MHATTHHRGHAVDVAVELDESRRHRGAVQRRPAMSVRVIACHCIASQCVGFKARTKSNHQSPPRDGNDRPHVREQRRHQRVLSFVRTLTTPFPERRPADTRTPRRSQRTDVTFSSSKWLLSKNETIPTIYAHTDDAKILRLKPQNSS